MPQQEHHEPLTGGVSAGENPFNFKEGELASMYNAIYRGAQDTPIVGPKLVKKGAVSVSASGVVHGVEGLAACPFPDATYIVALTKDGSVKTSSISSDDFLTTTPLTNLSWGGDSRPLGHTATPTDTTCLSTAQYNGKYFLFTGLNSANLLVDNGVIREHGLKPVKLGPAVVAVTSGGTWQPGVPGHFEYWTTEAIKTADGELVAESGIDENSAVKTVQITNLNNYTIVSLGYKYANKVNPNATHWRLYRSIVKTNATDVAFPNGELVAEFSFSSPEVSSIYDGKLTETHNTSGANAGYWTAQTNTAVLGTWANTSAVLTASNGISLINQTKFTAAPSGGASYPQTSTGSITLTSTSFNFVSPISPDGLHCAKVNGFKLAYAGAVKASGGGDAFGEKIKVEILFGTKTGWSAPSTGISKSIPSGPLSSYVTGGPLDTWGVEDIINPVDVTASNISLRFTYELVTPTAVSQLLTAYLTAATLYVYFDDVDANGEPFETISVNNSAPIQANSVPPVATCGAVFNDSLVTNDVSHPSRIRWSVPGMPESFPEPYYFDIPTIQNDDITGMWIVNNKLIVATDTTMWRINYLPLADDVSFQRGQIADLLDANSGCVGPLAATVYGGLQGRTELAYLDKSGLNSTDGFAVRPVANRFNLNGWLNQMRPIERKIILINESEESNIFIFAPYRSPIKGNPYVPGLTTSASSYPDSIPASVIVFNYGNNHLGEGGEFKCSGALAGLCEQTVTYGGTAYLRYVYPGAACLLRNTPILKEWGPGNVHLMLVGYTCSTPTDAAPPPTLAPMGHVCWMAPYRNFTNGGGNPFPATAALGSYSPMTSSMITRPIGLETVGGEFRTFEVYYGPRIETTSLTPKIRTFNIDQTSNENTYATLYSGNVTQKDNANLFSTAQQLTLAYDTSVPSIASLPHPHTYLLSSIIMRYDGYGKETR